MTQTELKYADLVAGLPDNQAEEISPSDVRNAFATALGGYGSLILSVSPATLFAVGATPVIVDIYDTIVAQSVDVNTAGTTVSLATEKITVGEDGIYFLNYYASLRVGANNRTVQMQPFLNTVATPIKILQRFGTGSDDQTMAFFGTFVLSKDDELDMRAAVVAGGATDLIFNSAGFSVFRVG
jgi:hypothetical protein